MLFLEVGVRESKDQNDRMMMKRVQFLTVVLRVGMRDEFRFSSLCPLMSEKENK